MPDSEPLTLTRADLDAGIDLGGRYLLAAQRPEGDFVYEVDWTTGEESPDDNAVRQAAATWAMALLYRETRDPAYRAALGRSLARWDAGACAADGRIWLGPQSAGQLGAVALVGLTLLDRLAAPEGLADPAVTRAALDALCAFVEDARLPNGGFCGFFDPEAGTHSGSADPYSSGEALLLLVRSGIGFSVPGRVTRALAWAEEDYDLFVAKPLAREPDPDLAKGYYQWGSMSWFTLASAGYAPQIWGRRLVEQALWMVEVHGTLNRTRNTGYAYEGIVPAWEWARRTGDENTARKLVSIIHQGLGKLCSWQLGHPLASAALRSAPERFHGAVQNHVTKPALRIDVTQHQLHALMLARRFGVDAAEQLSAGHPTSTSMTPAEHVDRDTDPKTSGWSARDLAEITAGVWEVMPPEGWTMNALAFNGKRVKPKALVIPKCRTYLYGVGSKTVRNLSGNGYALLTDDTPLGLPADVPRLVVASVRDALASLAVATAANFRGRIVAVTGSAGKTSSCNMIQDLLHVFGLPKRPMTSYNTFDGVNREVASLSNEAIAVIEAASEFLSQPRPDQLRPDVALITTIGAAHLNEFGSLQGVAEVKSNLFDLMPRGTAVIPRDDDFYDYLVQRARQAGTATVSYGTSPEADARLLSYSPADGLVEAQIFGESITYRIGAQGRHFAHNSVGALAVVAVLGLNWRRGAAALAASTELAGRGAALNVEIGNRNFTLIDDAYNANPISVRAAIETLSERPLAQGGRRLAVLADMLELGADGEDFHRALADPILQSGIDKVYLAGRHMRALWDILPSRVRGGYALKAADLWIMLEPEIAQADVVLCKGSHGTDLHKVVAALRRNGKRMSEVPAAVGVRADAAGSFRSAGDGPRLTVTEIRSVPGRNESRLASLVFLGDTSMGDYYLTDGGLSDTFHRLENNPWSFVELLAPLVQGKSLLIANLETVLAERPPDPYEGRKGYQGWDRPERTLSVLQLLGVDAVSLANNHTMDYGAAPLLATVAHLNTAGIVAFGAGANDGEAAQPLSFPTPFGNLHIFAGFEFRSSYARKWGFYAMGDAPGVNPLSNGATSDVSDLVTRTRARDPGSVIIVYPHWSGNTNYQWATDEMLKLNSELLCAGADLVIGHGAHRMQEITSSPAGTTVFSLGNFVFNSLGRYQKFDAPPFSLVTRLDLERQGSGITGCLRLYPIVSDNRMTGFRPRPVRESEAIEVYNVLERFNGNSFRDDFALEQDERGWHLTRTGPLSPRLAGAGAVRAPDVNGGGGPHTESTGPAPSTASEEIAALLAMRDAYEAKLSSLLRKKLNRRSMDSGDADCRAEVAALLDVAEPRHLAHRMVRTMERHRLSLRAGLSFKAEMVKQSEARRLGIRQPAWSLDRKDAAYRFINRLGVRAPRSTDPVPLDQLQPDIPCCVKPVQGTGGSGVFLVYAEDDIYHVRDGSTLPSWDAMISHAGTLTYGGRRLANQNWITEELILEDTAARRPARNLKFFSFYGEVLYILELLRQPDAAACHWSRDGQPINVAGEYLPFDGDGATPDQVAVVELISREIPAPFMRIDMLRSERDLVFGEFTPRPGRYELYPPEWDRRLGEAWVQAEGRIIADVMAGKRFEAFQDTWADRGR